MTQIKQMRADNTELLHSDITKRIIKCFYEVYNTLGYGFLEKVYETALYLELKNENLIVDRQRPIEVYYKNELVGNYFADLIIENSVIVEIKAAEGIAEEHEFQLINYLKATDIEVGLLLNFGKKPEFKRKIFSNDSVKIR
ncbi:MAG: GxxExxY protein [Bacteroidetes bacterium]|nr:GxxExxY protein [Bacteroidota bacterium]